MFLIFPTTRIYLSAACSVSATLGKSIIQKKPHQRSFSINSAGVDTVGNGLRTEIKVRYSSGFHSSFKSISEHRVAYIHTSKGFCTGDQKPGQQFTVALLQLHWKLGRSR